MAAAAAAGILERLQELLLGTGKGDSLPLYIGTALAALLLLVLLTRRGSDEASSGSGGRIRRAMSFTSAACAEGPMPPHAQMHPEDPIINAVVVLESAPTREEVVAAIQPLFYFERFRSRKVKANDRWFWEVLDAHEIHPSRHVIEEAFEGQGTDPLFRHLELLAQQPFRQPPDAPAFEFVVARSRSGKGPAAVVARINHAVGDGISLARLIPVVFKDLKGEPLPPSDKFRRREAGFKPTLKNPFSILSSLIKVLGTPMTAFDSDIGLTVPEKQKIVFTRRRTIVRIPTLKLSFIKSVKTAANVTVNDVIYAATAGAIHRLRAAHQDPAILDPKSAEKVKVRALLPVALPRQEGDPVRGMRNKWSFASVPMPVGAKTPADRLRASNAVMNELKNSPIVIVQNNFEALVGARLPWHVTQQVAYDSFVRHTFVFSNVPGPDLPVTLAGKAVTGLYMVYANLIPQVGALSLNGKIFTCMLLDPEVTPGIDKLGDYFVEELVELAKATGQIVTRADIVAEGE